MNFFITEKLKKIVFTDFFDVLILQDRLRIRFGTKQKNYSIFTSNFVSQLWTCAKCEKKRTLRKDKSWKRPWWGWTVAVRQPQPLAHNKHSLRLKPPQQCQCLLCQLQLLRISWETNWHPIFPNYSKRIHKNKCYKGKSSKFMFTKMIEFVLLNRFFSALKTILSSLPTNPLKQVLY